MGWGVGPGDLWGLSLLMLEGYTGQARAFGAQG